MDMITFLAWLYENCEGNQVETRALPARKQAFHKLGDWPAVEAWTRKLKGQNLYFAVATRNGGGTKEHIAEIPALWVDIDWKDVPEAEAKKALWEAPFRPSLLVESGGGYHVYWRLKEPAQRPDILKVEMLNRQLAAYLHGDLQATDASRILRIPGSLNQKYTPPRQVKVIWQTDLDWNLEDLTGAVPAPPRDCELSQASNFNKDDSVHIRGIEGASEATNDTKLQGSYTKRQEATRSDKGLDFDKYRDASIFHVANCLVKGGMSEQDIETALLLLHRQLPQKDHPFTEKDVQEKIKSALKRARNREKSIAREVREWVLEATGSYFETTQSYRELQLATRDDQRAARAEFGRLRREGILEPAGPKRGSYRVVSPECDDLDPTASTGEEIHVKWPLGIEELFRLLPGNMVLVAGEPDSGKTAFLFNFANLNMRQHEIFYFSSEMGECELKERLSLFQGMTLEDWKRVKFKDRAGDFADVIRPDAINIIDFLELHEEFYKVGKYLKEIHDRLKGGAALVAIQKNRGQDFGLGGQRAMEKARLYLTLSSNFPGGIAKIEKAKNWRNRGENPRGLQKHFRLYNGCQFSESSKWERPQ